MIAIIPTAMVAMVATNLLAQTNLVTPTARSVSLDIIPTAAIVEASNTIGFADSDLYGLNNPDGSLDEAAVLKTLDAMQALGVNDVRVLIPWAFVEPVPNATPFNPCPCWDRTDFIINAANARGMGVLGVITSTPAWGIKEGSGGFGYSASPDVAAYTAFAAATAERYANKVSAYEVGNEPNSFFGWTPGPDAAAYTEVLKSAYSAIKAADPSALVIGAVAVTVRNFAPFTVNAADFVSQMYLNGAKGYFDALSIHPYQNLLPFSQGGLDPDDPLNQLIDIRQLMIANGDQALRIWATEYGLNTSGDGAVSEQQQADFIKDFLQTWAGTSYAGPAFVYTTRDRVGLENTTDGSLGVYTSDWQMKLAAKVIRAILGSVNPTDPGQAIAKALNAIFQQLANSYVQAFASAAQTAVTAYVSAIAQAIKDALGAAFANLAVPATQQASIVEGVTAAKANIANLTVDTEASTDTSSADVEKTTEGDAKTLASIDGATVAGSEVVEAAADTTTATAPATPAALTEPVTPTTPVTPTESVTPVTPTEPATPTESVTPVTAATPTEPVTPTKPVSTSQPADGPTQAGSTPPADKPTTPKEKADDSSSTDTHSRPPRKPRTRDSSESGESTANATPDKDTKVTGGPGSAPASSPSTGGEAPSAATAGATA